MTQKKGSVRVLAGMKGSGKTTLGMSFISSKFGSPNTICYDPFNNFGQIEWVNESGGINKEKGLLLIKDENHLRASYKSGEKRIRFAPPFWEVEDFINILRMSKNFHILLEESTGLFPNGRIPSRLIMECQGTRHTGNHVIFMFHSLNSVPPQIFTFIDELYLFRTGDLERNIKSKFPRLLSNGIYERVNAHPVEDHYYELLTMQEFL